MRQHHPLVRFQRLWRKYDHLRRRMANMLADGSFLLLSPCRQRELRRRLTHRFAAFQRTCLRVGLQTAAAAAAFLVTLQVAQAGRVFVTMGEGQHPVAWNSLDDLGPPSGTRRDGRRRSQV